MYLITMVVVLAVGFGGWLTGHLLGYTGVASVGAVVIIAAGGAVALTDVEVRTGETVDLAYQEVNNETVVASENRNYQYETTALSETVGGDAGPLSFGAVLMILGGLLMTQHLNEVAS